MTKKHYIIPIFVPHEGCPHNCVFCNQNSITGLREKTMPMVDEAYIKNVVDEYLTTMDKENSIIELSFYGGTFTAIDLQKQKSLLKVAKAYKDQGSIDFIHLSTRPDYINEEILNNLKEYSVDIIELGIQSLDDQVLKLSGRGHSALDVDKATRLIKEYGFTVGHQIMLGLPGDNFMKDIETTKKSINMKPHLARIYPALVIKNTPMEDMYVKGIYNPYTLEEAVIISKIVYGMLIANNIKVIRMGLQPTEDINMGKEIIQGPFHPAFKELVEGSLMNDIIYDSLKDLKFDRVEITVNPKDISKIFTNRKQFFNDILKLLSPNNLVVKQEEAIDIGVISLKINEEVKNVSIKEIIKNRFGKGNYMDI